jgi:hypothetical protein
MSIMHDNNNGSMQRPNSQKGRVRRQASAHAASRTWILYLAVAMVISLAAFGAYYFHHMITSKAETHSNGNVVRGVVNDLSELDSKLDHLSYQADTKNYTRKPDYEKTLGTKTNPFVILEVVPNYTAASFGYNIDGCAPVDMTAMRLKKGVLSNGNGTNIQNQFVTDLGAEFIDEWYLDQQKDTYNTQLGLTNQTSKWTLKEGSLTNYGYYIKVGRGKGCFAYPDGSERNKLYTGTSLYNGKKDVYEPKFNFVGYGNGDFIWVSYGSGNIPDDIVKKISENDNWNKTASSASEKIPIDVGDRFFTTRTDTMYVPQCFVRVANNTGDYYFDQYSKKMVPITDDQKKNGIWPYDSSCFSYKLFSSLTAEECNNLGIVKNANNDPLRYTSPDKKAVEEYINKTVNNDSTKNIRISDLKLESRVIDYNTHYFDNLSPGTKIFSIDSGYYSNNEGYKGRKVVPKGDFLSSCLQLYSKEDQEKYSIVVKTIEPSELNSNDGYKWVDFADFIYIHTADETSSNKDFINDAAGLRKEYSNDEMVQKMDRLLLKQNESGYVQSDPSVEYGKPGDGYYANPENGYNDISFDIARRMFFKINFLGEYANNHCPLILNKTLVDASAKLGDKKSVTGKLIDYTTLDETKLTGSFTTMKETTGLNNNIYKLTLMNQLMNPGKFYQLFFESNKASDGKPVIDNNGNCTAHSGDAEKYWCSATFLPARLTAPDDGEGTQSTQEQSDIFHKFQISYNQPNGTYIATTEAQGLWGQFVWTYNSDDIINTKFGDSVKQERGVDDMLTKWYDDPTSWGSNFVRGSGEFSIARIIEYLLNFHSASTTMTDTVKQERPYRVLEIEPTNDFICSENYFRNILFDTEFLKNHPLNFKFTYMTTAEFNGKNTDLLNQYDAIYIGAQTGKFNRPVGSAKNAVERNDNNLNGYAYVHIGDKQGSYRTSGNDVTLLKLKQLQSYANNSDAPIFVDPLLLASKSTELAKTVQPKSNMYRFLTNDKNKDRFELLSGIQDSKRFTNSIGYNKAAIDFAADSNPGSYDDSLVDSSSYDVKEGTKANNNTIQYNEDLKNYKLDYKFDIGALTQNIKDFKKVTTGSTVDLTEPGQNDSRKRIYVLNKYGYLVKPVFYSKVADTSNEFKPENRYRLLRVLRFNSRTVAYDPDFDSSKKQEMIDKGIKPYMKLYFYRDYNADSDGPAEGNSDIITIYKKDAEGNNTDEILHQYALTNEEQAQYYLTSSDEADAEPRKYSYRDDNYAYVQDPKGNFYKSGNVFRQFFYDAATVESDNPTLYAPDSNGQYIVGTNGYVCSVTIGNKKSTAYSESLAEQVQLYTQEKKHKFAVKYYVDMNNDGIIDENDLYDNTAASVGGTLYDHKTAYDSAEDNATELVYSKNFNFWVYPETDTYVQASNVHMKYPDASVTKNGGYTYSFDLNKIKSKIKRGNLSWRIVVYDTDDLSNSKCLDGSAWISGDVYKKMMKTDGMTTDVDTNEGMNRVNILQVVSNSDINTDGDLSHDSGLFKEYKNVLDYRYNINTISLSDFIAWFKAVNGEGKDIYDANGLKDSDDDNGPVTITDKNGNEKKVHFDPSTAGYMMVGGTDAPGQRKVVAASKIRAGFVIDEGGKTYYYPANANIAEVYNKNNDYSIKYTPKMGSYDSADEFEAQCPDFSILNDTDPFNMLVISCEKELQEKAGSDDGARAAEGYISKMITDGGAVVFTNDGIDGKYITSSSVKKLKDNLALSRFTDGTTGYKDDLKDFPGTIADERTYYNVLQNSAGGSKHTFKNDIFTQILNGKFSESEVGYGSKAVYKTSLISKENDGTVTRYPYTITTFAAVKGAQAQTFQLNLENPDLDVYYCLSGDSTADNKGSMYDSFQVAQTFKRSTYGISPNDAANNYYMYMVNNTSYIGIDLNNCTDDEMKLFINTLCATTNVKYDVPEVRIDKGVDIVPDYEADAPVLEKKDANGVVIKDKTIDKFTKTQTDNESYYKLKVSNVGATAQFSPVYKSYRKYSATLASLNVATNDDSLLYSNPNVKATIGNLLSGEKEAASAAAASNRLIDYYLANNEISLGEMSDSDYLVFGYSQNDASNPEAQDNDFVTISAGGKTIVSFPKITSKADLGTNLHVVKVSVQRLKMLAGLNAGITFGGSGIIDDNRVYRLGSRSDADGYIMYLKQEKKIGYVSYAPQSYDTSVVKPKTENLAETAIEEYKRAVTLYLNKYNDFVNSPEVQDDMNTVNGKRLSDRLRHFIEDNSVFSKSYKEPETGSDGIDTDTFKLVPMTTADYQLDKNDPMLLQNAYFYYHSICNLAINNDEGKAIYGNTHRIYFTPIDTYLNTRIVGNFKVSYVKTSDGNADNEEAVPIDEIYKQNPIKGNELDYPNSNPVTVLKSYAGENYEFNVNNQNYLVTPDQITKPSGYFILLNKGMLKKDYKFVKFEIASGKTKSTTYLEIYEDQVAVDEPTYLFDLD